MGLLALTSAVSHAGPPQRLVSLDLCIDQVLTAIAPREQIAALSHYSIDPARSSNADLAKTFPVTYETAEEVVLLRPDFVLASRHSAPATRAALGRLGVRVKTYDVPDSIEASLAQVQEVADDIGQSEKGAALVEHIRREIRAARERSSVSGTITAAIYQPGGLSTGPTTLPGELMQIARLENITKSRFDIDGWAPLSLELLVSNPPQILLAGEATDAVLSRAQAILKHRAILRLDPYMVRASYPARLLYCGGPVILDSLAALEEARTLYLNKAGRR